MNHKQATRKISQACKKMEKAKAQIQALQFNLEALKQEVEEIRLEGYAALDCGQREWVEVTKQADKAAFALVCVIENLDKV